MKAKKKIRKLQRKIKDLDRESQNLYRGIQIIHGELDEINSFTEDLQSSIYDLFDRVYKINKDIWGSSAPKEPYSNTTPYATENKVPKPVHTSDAVPGNTEKVEKPVTRKPQYLSDRKSTSWLRDVWRNGSRGI